MALKIEDKAVFYHIPKTAGNWVRSVIDKERMRTEEIGHKHSNYDRVDINKSVQMSGRSHLKQAGKRLYKKVFTSTGKKTSRKKKHIFRFCFVRNPLDWYESWWRYQNYKRDWKKWGKEKWHPNRALDGLGSKSFNEFIENVLNKRPGYVTELFFSYVKPEIDFVGKKENIRNDLFYVFENAGISHNRKVVKKENKKNVSSKYKKNINWNKNLKNKMIVAEAPSMIRFGYMSFAEVKNKIKNIE
jgi:hypothetical protein